MTDDLLIAVLRDGSLAAIVAFLLWERRRETLALTVAITDLTVWIKTHMPPIPLSHH